MHNRLLQALLGSLVAAAYSLQTAAVAKTYEPHDLTPALRATPRLLKMGMVNPKDSAYRQVDVVIDCMWKKTLKVKTHGWVVAGDGKHALCWDGQVYPVKSIGPPADLRSDVLSVIAYCKGEDWPPAISNDALVTADVDWRSCDDRKIPLLLCLGQRDLASKLWTASDGRTHPGKQGKSDEWYVNAIMNQFLAAWLTGLWDRAAYAHQFGNDATALTCARQYVEALKQPEVETLRRDERDGIPHSLQETLAEQLLKDQQRRNAKPKMRAAQRLSDLDKAGQARLLIEQLDEVTGHIECVPGPICMDQNTRFDQLLKLGPSAVGPLIECLDSDPRLTRMVQRGRPWWPANDIKPVSAIAYRALCAIIKRKFGQTGQPWETERHELAKKIRQYQGASKNEPK